MKNAWIVALSLYCFCFCCCDSSSAWATTYTVNSGQSTATIAGVINGTVAGDTVAFSAGSYSITSGLTLKCGVTYTGPVVTLGSNGLATPTAILNGTFGSSGYIFNLFASGFAIPCNTTTTIQYLSFMNASGIYVKTSFTKLTVQYDKFGNIPYTSAHDTAGLYLDGATSISAQVLSNAIIQWNQFGDSTSCNGEFTIVNSGLCQGVADYSSVNGLTVQHNNFFHLSEGFHLNCPGNSQQYACEPPGGASSYSVSAQFNDFSNIHRINWEEQFQQSGGVVFKFNSSHDWLNPDPGSFGLSMACCSNGTVLPNLVVDSNLSVFNIPPWAGRYGYGQEAMGKSTTYTHNMVESGVFSSYAQGIAWGNGGGAAGNTFNFTNNYVCGTWTGYPNNLSQYISSEGVVNSNFVPPTTGSNYQPTCAVVKSQIPTISPTPTGTYSTPITVTITDNGFTSGAVAQGNTSIYYTTDGSTPTTSSQRCDSPCTPPPVAPGTTVNAIGMWGAANQPRSYAAGFGFSPSSVAGAHYNAGSTPTLTGVALTLTGGGSSVTVGNSVQAIASCSYAGVTSPTNCSGPGSDQYGTTANTWGSSATTKASITSSGSVTGVAAGSSNLTVHAGSFTSPNFALTVVAAAPVLVGLNVSCPTPISVGQTSSCTALCNYSGPQQLDCTHGDANGNTAGGWISSAPSIASVSSNVVTGVAVGSAQISATVGSFTSPATVQITGNTPPPATLTGVSVTCAPGSVTVGSTVSCKAACAYSDLTSADCTVTDAHGSLAGAWTSSVTADATINSTSGVVTGVAVGSTNIQTTAVNGATSVMSTPIALPVVAVPTSSVLGNNQFNVVGFTSANYINATYAVTGASTTGYTVSTCSFYLPTGTTYAAGSKWDCGIVLAPTPTTQASSWLCHATYTTAGTSADVGFHALALSGCGTLPHNTAYWIAVNTNETSPSQPGQGFWNCGSSCTGSAPTAGNGTYPCRYISATYGVYTGMQTTTAGICGSVSPQVQAAQFVTLNSPTPTLVSIDVSPGGFANTLVVGGSFTFSAFCNYSDGSSYQCSPGPSAYGDTVTAWASDTPSVMTIGNIGSTHPGVATGISAGFARAQATVTGGIASRQWGVTINAAPSGALASSSKVFRR